MIDGSFSSDIAVDFGDIGLPNSFFYGDANGWSATGTGASKAEGTHVSTVTPPASKGLSPCVLNFTVVVDDASTDITVTINSVSGCT